MSLRTKPILQAALAAAFLLSAPTSQARAQSDAPPKDVAPAAPQAPADDKAKPAIENLDEYLAGVAAEYQQPGIAAAVFNHSRILAIGVAGVRQLGQPDELLITDHLHIGSCTKAITSTMIATLVEEGVIWWDMPMEKALPDMAPEMNEAFRTATLAQFLEHSAGLPAFTSGNAPEFELLKGIEGSPREQRKEFTRRLLSRAPDYAPGSASVYSNADYAVAAAVAESISGVAWEDLITQRVFLPLAMDDSGFGWPATPDNPNQPFGHIAGPQGISPLPLDHPYRLSPTLAPAGDVNCSIEDFATFAQFHLAGILGLLPQEPGEEKARISQQQFIKMHLSTGQFAMGWLSARRGDSQLTWHNGSAGTFFSLMTLDPDDDIGVVVITNAGTGGKACENATRTLMDRFAPMPKTAP